ncbi:MAG: hypothetical protein N3A71_03065 [Candidatus Dojkabacteria bacterium]|nr:hypothetical protein [Candidatus Dojkabacteria bacterium]
MLDIENSRVEISPKNIKFLSFEYLDKFHFHFVHKSNNLSHIELLNQLIQVNRNLRFTLNLSLRHLADYIRINNPDLIVDKINVRIKRISKYTNISDVLLVSGNGSKIFTHDIINRIKSNIPIGVAYNPFFNKEYERYKLELKLSNPHVRYIYFQVGEDINVIKDEILFIKERYHQINIVLSIIFPTPSFFAKFRFRPWKHVLLSKRYLIDFEYSNSIFLRQIEFCIDQKIQFILVGDLRDIIKHFVSSKKCKN